MNDKYLLTSHFVIFFLLILQLFACTNGKQPVQHDEVPVKMSEKFYPPNEEDINRLARQLVFVDQLISKHYKGAKLDRSSSDLDMIQKIIDDKILSPNQTWELQSLGVVFGGVLAQNVPSLDWWIIDDEYGRDPTIRYKETSLRFNVLTMISKRVEEGEEVDIRHMYNALLEKLDELKDDVKQ